MPQVGTPGAEPLWPLTFDLRRQCCLLFCLLHVWSVSGTTRPMIRTRRRAGTKVGRGSHAEHKLGFKQILLRELQNWEPIPCHVRRDTLPRLLPFLCSDFWAVCLEARIRRLTLSQKPNNSGLYKTRGDFSLDRRFSGKVDFSAPGFGPGDQSTKSDAQFD